MDIIIAVIVLGVMGLLFGIILSIASKIFAVQVDPKIVQVRAALPGANCGACGYPGCDGLAEAIASGKASNNSCVVGGEETALKVSQVVGGKAEELSPKVAVVLCQGDCDKAKDKFIYKGIQDCHAQSILHGGAKDCSYGCLGCGTCLEACKFDSINIIGGIAVIDKNKCVACGKCVEVCPKKIIELIPKDMNYQVKCKSNDKGKDVREKCSIGCIGCQICVNNCPENTIEFNNNLAKIDYSKCTNCGVCASKCPTHAIPMQK